MLLKVVSFLVLVCVVFLAPVWLAIVGVVTYGLCYGAEILIPLALLVDAYHTPAGTIPLPVLLLPVTCVLLLRAHFVETRLLRL